MNEVRKKILILDDDEVTLQILKTRLISKGYEIYTGLDGLEGLVKVRQEMPDLIILDIMMPKIDGLEFFKVIKKSEIYANIPVIIITSKDELREQLLVMGCDYFAAKPFQPNEIMDRVEILLKPKILIFAEDTDFRKKMEDVFFNSSYRTHFAKYKNEFFQDLAKGPYELLVVRLAEVQDEPAIFMHQVQRDSANKKVMTLIFSDESVLGTVDKHLDVLQEIERLQVDWVKAGDVLFYDKRLNGPSLTDFIDRSLVR